MAQITYAEALALMQSDPIKGFAALMSGTAPAGSTVGPSGGGATSAAGDVANDAVDSGNPVKMGGRAETTAPTAVADGDRVNAWFDEYGRLVIVPKFSDGTTLQNANGIFQQGSVASGATDAGNPVKIGGRYNSTAPTLTDGQRGDIQLDPNAFQLITEGAVEVRAFADSLAEVTKVIKATPGYLMSIYGINRNAAARYLQLHNTTAAPSAAAVPVMEFLVALTATVQMTDTFFGRAGRSFSVGITAAWSTTSGTYTAATAADHDTFAAYA